MTNESQTVCTAAAEPVKSCVDCAVKACRKGEADKYPAFCLTKNMDPALLQSAIEAYSEEENHKVMESASAAEAKFRSKMTRVEETIEFAKRMGAKKIGIGTCMGLLDEAKIFAKILRKHGFEVYGVCCKTGSVDKLQIGLEVKDPKKVPKICNPILQAKVLNEAGTDLNIAIGLCVGHDSLFYKYSDALVTTLVAKDRVTGHNPCAPLYTLNSFYSGLMEDKEKK